MTLLPWASPHPEALPQPGSASTPSQAGWPSAQEPGKSRNRDVILGPRACPVSAQALRVLQSLAHHPAPPSPRDLDPAGLSPLTDPSSSQHLCSPESSSSLLSTPTARGRRRLTSRPCRHTYQYRPHVPGREEGTEQLCQDTVLPEVDDTPRQIFTVIVTYLF